MNNLGAKLFLCLVVGAMTAGTAWGQDSGVEPRRHSTPLGIQNVAQHVTAAELVSTPVPAGPTSIINVPADQPDIQAAIDAASPGDIINVYPSGSPYTTEEANARDPFTGGPGTYDYNIFVNKAVTIRGVDASGNPITNHTGIVAHVIPKRLLTHGNNCAIFVQADGVTITGLEIDAKTGNPGYNFKTIEAVGNNLVLKYCKLNGLDETACLYIDDIHFNPSLNTSHVESYTIQENYFDGGGPDISGIRISSGPGWTGSVANRLITGNTFVNTCDAIALVGPGADPWDLYPVGSATITGNTFSTSDRRHLIAWGQYDGGQGYAEPDWGTLLSSNTFDKGVVTWTPTSTVRGWDLAPFYNVKGLYTAVQRYAITYAQAGDRVQILPGTYEEQLEVMIGLTIEGSGAPSTSVRCPVTLTKHFNVAGGPENYPVIYVHDAAGVTISSMTIDGFGRGNTNYRFQGVAFRNAGGAITNCTIKDVRETPINGNQHGVALYAYADNGIARSLNVSNNTITGFQKNGTALGGANLTAAVDGNTIAGAGSIDFTAQNGIQLGYGSAGSITNNVMTGFSYTPASYIACAMLLYQPASPVTTSNNTITASQMGIYYYNVGGTISGNTISATAASVGVDNYWAIDADPGLNPRIHVQAFDEHLRNERMPDNPNSITTTIHRNILTSDGTHGTAIEMDALGTETLNGTATENTVHGWDAGIVFYKEAGATLNGLASNNDLGGNTYALYDLSGVVQDGSGNWLGSVDPATVATLVTANVDYTPWLGSGTDTDPVAPGFQGDLSTLWVGAASPQVGSTGRIQEGINLVTSGGVVSIAGGTYHEGYAAWTDILVNKPLSLIGGGPLATVVELRKDITNGIYLGASGITVQGIKFTKEPANAYGPGFNIRSTGAYDNIHLIDVESEYSQSSSVLFDGAVTYNGLTITNCNFHHSYSERVFYQSPATTFNNFVVTNSHFDYAGFAAPGTGDPVGFQLQGITNNLVINGGTFNECPNGGIGFWRVTGATIANVTINHSGFKASGDRAGFSIWEQYFPGTSDIAINNLTLTNCGGRGLMLGTWNGRITNVTVTGGSFGNTGNLGVMFYAGQPGDEISNVLFDGLAVSGSGQHNCLIQPTTGAVVRNVDFHRCQLLNPTLNNLYFYRAAGTTVDGSNDITECEFVTNSGTPLTYAGVRLFGDLAGAMTIFGNSFSGNGYAVRYSDGTGTVNSSGNWLGEYDPSGAAMKISGSVDYTPWLNSGSDAQPGTAGFQGDFSNLWVSAASPQVGSTGRIQEGIDMVTGSTVNVAGGIYAESVNANKANLNLLGEGAATTTINPGSSGLNCITVSTNGCTISGFTLTGGQNGISGTTSGSKFKNCVIAGNSQNGIRLVDGDFNFLQGNTISGHAAGAGVLFAGSKQNTVAGNTIQNNNYNVQIDINGARTSRGNLIQGNNLWNPGTWSVNVNNEPRTTKVNFNVFSPADKYVRNFTSSAPQMVDATYNWFGGESTPLVSHFSGAVDYTHNYATDPTVAVLPASYCLPIGTTVTLDVMALIPAGTYVRGVDVTLSWTNDTQIPDQGDPVEGSFFSGFPSRVFWFDHPTPGSVVANSAILGPTTGAGNPPGGLPYVGTIFSHEFTGIAEGTSTLMLSGVQLRDPDNNPLTPIVIDPTAGAQLIVDGTPPSVTGVFIDNTSIDNDNFVKNTDNVAITATVTDANPLAAEDIFADLSSFYGGTGHTADNPASYAGNVATWNVGGVTCSPTDGTVSVTVAAGDLAGNTGTGSDNITADNTPPSASTALVAKTVSPGGHENVALSWTAGSDANYRGVVIRYNAWSYPTYPVGSTPTYPATPLAGTGVSPTPITGTSTTHAIAPRNVYYYSLFAVDWAGNYSPLDITGTDRAADYYLGDLGSGTGTYIPGSGGYNGLVNYEDLFWFSRLYFSSAPGWTVLDPNAAESDFGPTVANKTYPAGNRFGIPHPDGRIDFEDLMIFSMNYYNVLPRIEPPQNKVLAEELTLGLEGNNRIAAVGEELVVALTLACDGSPVKGTSVTLKYDPQLLQVMGVDPGTLFGTSGQGFFAHNEGSNTIQIDQAVLGVGRTVDYSGTLALIRFKSVRAGEARITIDNGIVRDGENSGLTPVLCNEVVELPTTFALAQNYPNPFNPSTVIRYQLPSPVHVELTIFNVIGEKVATLVNEVQEPGYYRITWNASGGSSVASGMYFYVLRAGEFTSIKKMMLLK